MRTPIIAGIDPGTTTGYAILDTEGNITKIGSYKNVGLNSLIRIITEVGKPIIVGCDKKSVPEFIAKFAAKTGARIISPEEDLLVEDKKRLASKEDYKNTHEMDALASAIMAFKKTRSVIARINKFCEKSNKNRNRIMEIVIKEGISISAAADKISGREKKKKERKEEPVRSLKDEKIIENTILRLKKKITKKESEIIKLKGLQKALSSKLKTLQKENSSLKRKIENKKKDHTYAQIIKEKNDAINNLNTLLKNSKKENHKLKCKINSISKTALKRDMLAVRSAKNLTLREIKRLGKINKDDILYIETPSVFSISALETIKEKVDIIITPNLPKNSKKLRFLFIDSKKVKAETFGNIGFINKKDLRKELTRKEIISKIIEDYKDRRKKINSTSA